MINYEDTVLSIVKVLMLIVDLFIWKIPQKLDLFICNEHFNSKMVLLLEMPRQGKWRP